MSAFAQRLRIIYLQHFSKPASDRQIYQLICKGRMSRILELGIGRVERALRMVEAACRWRRLEEVHYSGIDLFEARNPSDGRGLSLKQAHKLFQQRGIRARLVPGDPFSALSRAANTLGQFDLVVVSTDIDRQAMARAWFYLPRLLHPRSKVVVEQAGSSGGQPGLRVLSTARVEQIAARTAAARRAA